jgi:hypothetical protein
MEVYKRIEKHEPAKEKVVQNLPAQEKSQNVGTLLDNWRSVLGNIKDWVDQNSAKSGR